MGATRRISAAAIATTGLLFGGSSLVAYAWWHRSLYAADSYGQQRGVNALAPTDPLARFHHYAACDADGIKALDSAGLIACLCLLDEESRQSLAREGQDHLPPHVRQRLEHVFHLVDVDHDSSLSYEEFCILLTLLSVRRHHLKLAFGVFDRDEDGRLSRHEFRHLLNALMVDPAVQVVKHRPSPNQQQPTTDPSSGVSLTPIVVDSEVPRQRQSGVSTVTKEALLTSPLAEHFFGIHSKQCISFEEFWLMLRELRREVWGVAFGLYDLRNTGQITLQDLRRIIFRGGGKEQHRSVIDGVSNVQEEELERRANMSPEKELISWDFYLKLLDVLCECDAVAYAMDLFRRAKLPEVTAARLGQQHPTESKTGRTDSSLQSSGECEMDSVELYRALTACKELSHITREDADRLLRIFHLNGLGRLSPAEFAQVCGLRTTFFTPRQSRFTELQRNPVQRFIFCMQQLK
ncbi:hypothetical protein TraAM80_02529 [Trypanosoma rangeli]|uniref:EF-hand domain-containing protein n=1 Tax=Trypanosoma rangeli TaxID=5698 RepID=A0A3R7M4Z0_TRYRA|nr:uncharacterized protein TraAM80_02529 [Trypanosoma rangeli]RNF09097.1 hypothetical protein TraAM80_02529 [Trypanosoma rangeli]|eukprot:RNF09097.1 hypothetical protein TraAM80_02529 [Trypanosoma rangeli]